MQTPQRAIASRWQERGQPCGQAKCRGISGEVARRRFRAAACCYSELWARLGIEVKQEPDLVTSKLEALKNYQHSLVAPPPPAGTFDQAAAGRGKTLFDKSCASCHVGGSGTDNNDGKLHAPAETKMDGAYAARTATKMYRTTPLRGLWQHAPYFHDGSAKTPADVISHYNRALGLKLTDPQKRDLVEYLKTL
jgi:mono/diheme cytochrome c family protein